jgi:hypothetical protein
VLQVWLGPEPQAAAGLLLLLLLLVGVLGGEVLLG